MAEAAPSSSQRSDTSPEHASPEQTSPEHTSPDYASPDYIPPVHTPPVHTPTVHTLPVHTPTVHTLPVHTPPVHTPSEHTPSERAQTCIFCRQADDEKRYGQLFSKDGVTAHNFCLLFSSGLAQLGEDDEGLSGFLPADVLKEYHRSKPLRCAYCKTKGASVGCSKLRCKKSFHYGCGKDHGTMFLYHDDFRTYCVKHRRAQDDMPAKEKQLLNTKTTDTCYICYETLETVISPKTVLAPCCTRAWYHYGCLDDMAYSAGLHFFKCPLCNNVDEWQAEMLKVGIYIPDRDASWELEPNAYNSLLETKPECEAEVCTCPQGRFEDDSDSEWELILCETCGSQACHPLCGKLREKDKEWLCRLCRSSAAAAVEKENEVSEQSTRNSRKRQLAVTPNKARPSRVNRQKEIHEVTNLMQNNCGM